MHSFFNRNYKELLTPEEQRKYASVILWLKKIKIKNDVFLLTQMC
jgi:hypothetical protein